MMLFECTHLSGQFLQLFLQGKLTVISKTPTCAPNHAPFYIKYKHRHTHTRPLLSSFIAFCWFQTPIVLVSSPTMNVLHHANLNSLNSCYTVHRILFSYHYTQHKKSQPSKMQTSHIIFSLQCHERILYIRVRMKQRKRQTKHNIF